MDSIFIKLIEQFAEFGPFALFSFLLLFACGYSVWKLGSKFAANYENNMNSIVSSNVKFAESSEKMVDLVDILVKQTESTVDQLRFIKRTMQRHDFVLLECIQTIKAILPEDKEVNIRLENIIKEIQRPIDG